MSTASHGNPVQRESVRAAPHASDADTAPAELQPLRPAVFRELPDALHDRLPRWAGDPVGAGSDGGLELAGLPAEA